MTPQHPPALPDPGEFNWGTVPAAVRAWLGARTHDIQGLAYRQACDAVTIGAWLNEARAKLKRGLYERWVAAALPFSLVTAHRYRRVADAFGAFVSCQFEMFDVSALYVLADLRTPPEVRERAVARARARVPVTRADALKMLAEHAAERRAGEGDVAAEFEDGERDLRCLCLVRDRADPAGPRVQCPVVFRTTAANRTCPRCRDAAEKRDARGRGGVRPEDAARWWGKFVRLVAECPRLRFDAIEDADHEDADVLYTGTAYPADPGAPIRQTPALSSIDQVIGHLAGDEDTKECANCRRKGVPGCVPGAPPGTKPLSAFNRDEKEAQGVARWCRACMKEKKRRTGGA
jgi:hypothetical protein